MSKHKFTLEAGRQIYRDGKPFMSVGREGDTAPHVADQFARHIVVMLNKSGRAKKYLRDMEHRGRMSQDERRAKAHPYLEK